MLNIGRKPRAEVSTTSTRRMRRVLTLFVTAATLITAIAFPAAAQTTFPPSFDRVITFGDSFAAGTGIYQDANNYDNRQCLAEDDTTPGARYADWYGGQSTMLACQAARAVHTRNQVRSVNFNNDGRDDLLLVSAGGNDVRIGDRRWDEQLLLCSLVPGCSPTITNLADVQDELEFLYELIVNRADEATIRVFGYPKMMDPPWGICHSQGIGVFEANSIDGEVRRLNATIRAAVRTVALANPTVDLEYIDTYDHFDGHGACRTMIGLPNSRWIRRVTVPTAQASYHPNQEGYDAFYTLLVRNLRPPAPPGPPDAECLAPLDPDVVCDENGHLIGYL